MTAAHTAGAAAVCKAFLMTLMILEIIMRWALIGRCSHESNK